MPCDAKSLVMVWLVSRGWWLLASMCCIQQRGVGWCHATPPFSSPQRTSPPQVLEPMTHDANAKRAGLSRCQIRVPLEKLVTCSLLPSIEPPSPAASPFLAAAPAPLSPALLPQNLMAQHVEPAAGLVPLGEGSCEAPPDAAVAPPADSPSTDTATTSPPADTLAAAGAAGEGDVGGEGGEVVASSPLLLAPGGGAALPGDAPDAGKAAAGVEGEAGTGDVTAKGEEWKGDGKRAKAASELDRVRAEVRKAEARRSAQAGQAGVEGWGGHAQQAHGVSIPAHARPRREGSVSGDGSGEGSAPLVRRGEGRRLLVEWDCGDAIGRRSVVIAETGGLRHVEWVAQTLQDNKAALVPTYPPTYPSTYPPIQPRRAVRPASNRKSNLAVVGRLACVSRKQNAQHCAYHDARPGGGCV